MKKKQGFPSVTDKGVADIFMGGTGFSFKIALETADKSDGQHFFKVGAVTVDVKNMKIKLKQSNHKLLFNIFKPLLLTVLRPVIQKVLEKQIKDSVHQMDGLAYQVHQEAKRTQEHVKQNPQDAPNVYNRYLQAAQKQMTKGKKKQEEASQDKTVNVAMTQHDSIFKNIQLPGGISTKATEYKNLAAQGDKWESPVFGIGSARETSSLPSVSKVSRKQHRTAEPGVRGTQNMGSGGQSSTSGYDQTGSSGYGQSTGAGYGQTSGTGYSQTSGTGYNQPTGAGYTQGTSPSAGFSNQVNQAFEGGQDYSLKSGTGATTGTSGINGTPTHGGTLLGANNPVLSGLAPADSQPRY